VIFTGISRTNQLGKLKVRFVEERLAGFSGVKQRISKSYNKDQRSYLTFLLKNKNSAEEQKKN
jgi:hypothetical protein